MSRPNTLSRPGAWRRRVVLGGWVAACTIICVRAVQIQVAQGAQWRATADAQHNTDKEIPAARGAVMDRDGTLLAVSRETYRVSVAPQEVSDPAGVGALLQESLGISAKRAKQLLATDRRWAVAPGRYPPAVREALAGTRGVYVERELER